MLGDLAGEVADVGIAAAVKVTGACAGAGGESVGRDTFGKAGVPRALEYLEGVRIGLIFDVLGSISRPVCFWTFSFN